MSYRDLPRRLSPAVTGFLGGILGALAVLLIAAPECARAGMQALLAPGLRG